MSCGKQQFKNRKKNDCWHHSVERQKNVRNARTNFPEHVPHGELVPHKDQPKKWRWKVQVCDAIHTKRADIMRHVEPGLAAATVLPWTA